MSRACSDLSAELRLLAFTHIKSLWILSRPPSLLHSPSHINSLTFPHLCPNLAFSKPSTHSHGNFTCANTSPIQNRPSQSLCSVLSPQSRLRPRRTFHGLRSQNRSFNASPFVVLSATPLGFQSNHNRSLSKCTHTKQSTTSTGFSNSTTHPPRNPTSLPNSFVHSLACAATAFLSLAWLTKI